VNDVFTHIYQVNGWGGAVGEYYSGSGSDDVQTREFVSQVRALIYRESVHSIIDLGCGDFRVGSQILTPGLDYTGIDIVASLIDRNNARFGSKNARFIACNIIEDQLPGADLCIIRQVLQHLSNEQITRILGKVSAFPLVVIAEHHPAPTRFKRCNLNKAAGGDVRIVYDSGVYLEEPPYSLQNLAILCRTPVREHVSAEGEVITTYLLDNRKVVSADSVQTGFR
jgi:hypothetical protein